MKQNNIALHTYLFRGMLRHLVVFVVVLTLTGSATILLIPARPAAAEDTQADSLSDLNQQLSDKRKEIQQLEDQQDVYKKTIETKQNEQRTLNNEIELLDTQISSTQVEIEQTKLEIDSVKIEMEKTQEEIRALADDILTNKGQLSEFVQLAYRNSQKTYLEIALTNDSFSDFVRQAKYTESIEGQVKKSLERLKTLKSEQETKRADLEAGRKKLEDEQQALQAQQSALDEQSQYKEALLDESIVTEEKYQDLLESLQSDQNRINSEIFTIENRVRQRLEEEGGDPLEALGEPIFQWPVPPLRGVSAYFHDPSYPFRNVFEHPAIDIPAPHGTALAAAADGVVAIVRNLDWKTINGVRVPAYNYVTLLHGDGFSTVYGHLSRIDVSEGQYVTKGQIIGATGATPGTAGAGTLTTGAHLHFEVRINGIPDDPLKYLP